VKVRSEYMDGSNRTTTDGEIFLSQQIREQTHPQGTCGYTSGQGDLSNGVPKSAEDPSKACAEKLSADDHRRGILVHLLN
jgi:hypothetical protein